jgi:hypothetical protein
MENNLFTKDLIERADFYCRTMEDLTGIDPKDQSHRRYTVACRAIIAWTLFQDGFTLQTIGGYFGLSHCSVVHYRHKVETMFQYPNGFRRELRVYDEFQRRIAA